MCMFPKPRFCIPAFNKFSQTYDFHDCYSDLLLGNSCLELKSIEDNNGVFFFFFTLSHGWHILVITLFMLMFTVHGKTAMVMMGQ